MKSWAANKLKQLCWALALLALVQPALSLDCRCVCNAHREGNPTRDKSEASHCHHDGAACCHHDHEDRSSDADCGNAVSLSLLALVEFHPCQCPSDCDCQLGHRSAKTPAVRPKTSDRASLPLTPFAVCPSFTQTRRAQDLLGISSQIEGKRSNTAQSACAELCRFLS